MRAAGRQLLLALQCLLVLPAGTAATSPAPAPPAHRGLVVVTQGFRFFAWGDVVRSLEIRSTRPDRQCLETTMMRRGTAGDSIVSHGRVIWRLDRGVRWSLDLLDRTYTEADLRTEQELSEAFEQMLDLRVDSVVVDLGERDTIAGWAAERYRWHLRVPKTGELAVTTDGWIAAGLPGETTRRAFTDRLHRVLGSTRDDTGSAAVGKSPVAWPRGGRMLRELVLIEEEEGKPSSPVPVDTSECGRMAQAMVPRIFSPPRDTVLTDSLSRAWRVELGSRTGTGEEVVSIREVQVPDGLFEIPPGFRKQPLSNSKELWPWAKTAKRAPPGTKRDPRAPPRLNPFATLDARRDTPLRPDPSTRHTPKLTIHANDLLDPIELDPVNGFYRVKESRSDGQEGWIAAADVEELGDEPPSNIAASASDLTRTAQRMNNTYRAEIISSIRADSGRVVVVVGKGWQGLDANQKKAVGYSISYDATRGGGAASIVFRDSLTLRTVATYKSGALEEH